MKFEELDIPEPVLRGIRDAGFTACTPIQAETLPQALRGEDVAAQSQTGTGKTAAFLVAIFSRILREEAPRKKGKSPRVLIIAPTRELVDQIRAEAERLGRYTGLTFHAVFGGVQYVKQREVLEAGGIDILIGTPGRLIDYFKQKAYSLRNTRYLVIDEADRMFDMGFIADIRYLLRKMPPYQERQSMLFSATLSYRVMELGYQFMNLGDKISVTPDKITVEGVEQILYHVGADEKRGLLFGILKNEPWERVLVFTNTKAEAEKLIRWFDANGYQAAAITGDIQQRKRLSIIRRFKEGSLPILVATDVASRGLHIDGVSHVVNYDLPQDPEDYVHRIGRTARAGKTGNAISLACERYVYSLEGIEEYIGQAVPASQAPPELIIEPIRPPARRRDRGRGRTTGSEGRGSRGRRGRRPEKSGEAAGGGSTREAEKGARKKRRRPGGSHKKASSGPPKTGAE